MVTTRILPAGEQLDLEPKVLRPLIREALDSAAKALSGRTMKTQRRRLGVIGPDGFPKEVQLEIPDFLQFGRVLTDRLDCSPAGSALTEYLWSRNPSKLQLRTADDSELPKDAWASFTWRH